jgi:ABC-2 type transport system ATP-binding protein
MTLERFWAGWTLEVPPMLELRGLSKRFGALSALDDCTFTAEPGRLTGFVGPNGAGKTTAMRAVFGLVALDSGVVLWRTEPVGRAEWSRFGYMPEERGLYPRMRVRDQLVYLGRLSGRSKRMVGRTVDTWLERLGLDTRAKDRVDTLSHGNQQRVQLIAALVNDPVLLVLDEPFAGLDPLAIANMSDLLHDLASDGVAILFSSHQLDLVEDICQDVVIIDHGRVITSGDLAQLRAATLDRFVDVRFCGQPPDWSVLADVVVLESGDGHSRLRVKRQTDLADVVTSALGGTEIVSFSYQPPTLSELFREAVLR